MKRVDAFQPIINLRPRSWRMRTRHSWTSLYLDNSKKTGLVSHFKLCKLGNCGHSQAAKSKSHDFSLSLSLSLSLALRLNWEVTWESERDRERERAPPWATKDCSAALQYTWIRTYNTEKHPRPLSPHTHRLGHTDGHTHMGVRRRKREPNTCRMLHKGISYHRCFSTFFFFRRIVRNPCFLPPRLCFS